MSASDSNRSGRTSAPSTKLLLGVAASLAGVAGICLGYFSSRYLSKSNVVLAKGYRGKLQTSVRDYIDKMGNRNVPYYVEICDETRELFGAIMEGWTVSIDQCYFLQWLMPSLGIKHALEVGVFTGCSSLAIALGVGPQGSLTCFDIEPSRKYTNVAQKYWQKAGVSDRVSLSLEGGIKGLDGLLQDEKNLEKYDFAFVDAHKSEYVEYYKRLFKLVKVGGYIAYDNTVYEGKVADEINFTDELTQGIRDFNRLVHDDKRVEIAQVYLGDGTTFIRKISN